MVSVVVEKEIPVPAEKMWSLLADFGDISWSGLENAEVEGVGMIRRIIVGEGLAVERLDARDQENMTFTYSILSGNPKPVDNIQGSPRVSVVDEGRCRLSWSVTAQETGVSKTEAEQMLSGLYSGLLETIAGVVLGGEELR